MARADFNDQWNQVKNYLDGTNPGALELAALSPRPRVFRDDEEQSEDKLPIIAIGMMGSAQQRDKAAAQNTHQMFYTKFHLFIATKGPDLPTSNTNCLAIVSAVVNDLAGIGSFIGTDRSKLFAAIVDSWDWDPADSDSLVAQAFLDITGMFYRV